MTPLDRLALPQPVATTLPFAQGLPQDFARSPASHASCTSLPQVIAGQLAGTLFNTESARLVELETQAQANGTAKPDAQAAAKNSARNAALRARDASRTLQALPSEVEPRAMSVACMQGLHHKCMCRGRLP